MNTKEIYRELDMTYDELVDYLLKKYGAAQYDYFTNEACTSKSKRISRTEEGLFCHHIDEDKGFKLSDKSSAIKYPFDYQRANRLVYCNYLEHLMLHIRIGIEMYWRKRAKLTLPSEIPYLVNPGFGVLAQEINTLFDETGSTQPWRQRCFEEIKDNYDEYIYVLRWFLTYIDKNYVQGKIEFSKGQTIKHPKFGYGVITGFVEKPLDMISIQFDSTEKRIVRSYLEKNEYKEMLCKLKENLSRTSNGKLIKSMVDALQ